MRVALRIRSLVLVCLLAPLSWALAADTEPPQFRWERQYYGTLDTREVLLYADSLAYSKPAFGDLYGNTLPDLVVGRQNGSIARFDNVGKPGAPLWRLAEEQMAALHVDGARRVMRAISVGSQAAPALVDIDGDGDLDLIVGTADGRLILYRNTGSRQLPLFEWVTDRLVAGALGESLVPFFVDLNGDQAPDLLLGNARGQVYLLMNQGTRRDPSFCGAFPAKDAPDEEPACTPPPRLVADIRPELHAAPSVADWDGKGNLELFVGKSDGTIAYYENGATSALPEWRLVQSRFLAIDDGGYAAPALTDGNGDGHPDLFVGSSGSNVSLYTSKGTGKLLDVWKEVDNVLQARRLAPSLERLVIASGDVDGDGDLDLIIGDRNGGLLWVENTGNAKAPRWRVKQENLLGGTPLRNSAPVLADIDGDGDLDLIVGGAEGKLWLLRNGGTAKGPRWNVDSTAFAGVEVGANSVPALLDIDGDGDLDLFVGNARGQVIFYRNEGSKTEPNFKLVSTRFGEISVGQMAAPAFLDWNGDKLPDLAVGNRDGKLALVLNGNTTPEAQLRTWSVQSLAWDGILVRGFAAPHFADLNGDGLSDLLIGDGEGNLRLYYRVVAPKPPPPPPAAAETGAPGLAGGVGVITVPPPVGLIRGGGARGSAARPGSGTSTAASADGLTATSTSDLLESEEALPADTAAAPAGPIKPVLTLKSEKYGDIQMDGKAVPAFGDLDGDGDLDLVVGAGKGQLVYYRNTGSAKEAKWTLVPGMFDLPGARQLSPIIADLDGDGLLDVLVGTEAGTVVFFKNAGTKTAPRFVLQADALRGVHVGREAAPAVGRLGPGAETDLLVGSFPGNLYFFQRVGGARSLNFRLLDRHFLRLRMGVGLAPFLGDLDGDGVLDLLVGSDPGRVAHFVRGPDPKRPQEWKVGPDYFKGLRFPPGPTPRLADIDGDGSMDLFVGTGKGTIFFYRNETGIPQEEPAK
jgi:uncharacterized protein (DUF2141 family)